MQHEVPSKGFTNHFLLGRLIAHLSVHEAEKRGEVKKMVCGSGLDSNAAAGWCVDCHSYLCQQCLDLHKRQKMSKSHKTLTLAEVKEGALSQVDQKYMCSEHEGEELKLYCKTCQDVLCRDCTIVTHKGHDYLFIKNAKEEIIRNLQQLLVQVEEKDVEFQKCIADVETATAAKKESVSECEEQLNKYFNEYIQKIEHHRASLLDELHHDAMNDEKVLVTEKEDLEFTKARLTSAIAFTKQLLSSGNMADIVHLSKQASEQLESLTKMKKQDNVDERTWHFVQKEPPTECSVALSIRLSFVNPPNEVPHGLNEIDIRAPDRPNVSIITDLGKSCRVTGITPTSRSLWHVTYVIPAPPLTNGVQITAQVLQEKVSMRLTCIQTLAVGTRVVGLSQGGAAHYKRQGHRRVGVVAAVDSGYVSVQWGASLYFGSGTEKVQFGPSYFEVKTEY